MSVELDLLTGLAQFLNDAGVAVFKPAGGYAAADTAIVFGDLQPDPDRMVALTIYASTDEVKLNLSAYRVQIYCRGVPNSSVDSAELAASIFDALQGVQGLQWGSVWMQQARRVSLVPMGIDANLRAERADSYEFQVNTPATPRRNQ